MPRPAIALTLLVPVHLLASPPSAVATQLADTATSLHRQALEHLAAADTAAALMTLRELTQQHPKYGPGWLDLAKVLSAQASEALTVFKERQEARRALDRAWRLMPGHPDVLYEYGLLLVKQNARVDAKRVLERSLEAAEKPEADVGPIERGRMHHALARIYEASQEPARQGREARKSEEQAKPPKEKSSQ